jgi:hypothetical protein
VAQVKEWFVLALVAAGVAVGVTVLAGKDDIRRFWRMRSM